MLTLTSSPILSPSYEVTMNTKKTVARLGGLATLNRHGAEYFSAIGRLGGRPKLEPLIERQSATPDVLSNNLRRSRLASASMRELKELWRQRVGEAGSGLASPFGGEVEIG